jgi:hypothetical protein
MAVSDTTTCIILLAQGVNSHLQIDMALANSGDA